MVRMSQGVFCEEYGQRWPSPVGGDFRKKFSILPLGPGSQVGT